MHMRTAEPAPLLNFDLPSFVSTADLLWVVETVHDRSYSFDAQVLCSRSNLDLH